jgi:hypothetical protein
MPIDPCAADRGYESDEAGWRAPPRCYTRPVQSEAAVRRSDSEAESSAGVFVLGILRSLISCIAVLLMVQSGWSI